MLNRNNIFKRVRDTTNTLNVSTNRRIDNVYTELMEYENMAQSRYDKIKDILETIRYHHNKIENLNKNYQSAIFGGSVNTTALLTQIENAIETVGTIATELDDSEFDVLLIRKHQSLLTNIEANTIDETNNIDEYTIKNSDITETHKAFFTQAKEELSSLQTKLDSNKTNILKLLETIKQVDAPITEYINEKKLSRDLRESIKKGINTINSTIQTDIKGDSSKFNNYSANIRNGLGYATQKEAENKNPNQKIDQKILAAYFKKPNDIRFVGDASSLSGKVKISGSTINVDIQFEVEVDETNTHIATINSDLSLKFKLNKKLSAIEKETTGTLLFESVIHNITQTEFKKYKAILEISKKKTETEFKKYKAILEINKKKKTEIELSIYDITLKCYINLYTKYIELHFKDNIINSNTVKITRIDTDQSSIKYIKKDKKDKKAEDKAPDKEEEDKATDKEEEDKEEEEEKKGVEDIIRIYEYLNKDNEKTGGGPEQNLKDLPDVKKFISTLNLIKSQLLDTVEQKTDNKKSSDPKNTSANLTTTISNSIISSLIQNYEKERKTVNSIEDKIKLDGKFVDNLDNLGLNLADIFKVNFNDKLAFIFFILVLHIVVYSLIESLIMNSYVSDIVYIMALYVGIYCVIIFILILILNKYVNYRMKTLLNYLNTDFNLQLISMHIFIVFMFYIIVLILSQHIDIFVAKDEDDKLQVLYRIEVISSVIFIFSSVFVMLL
jgi:hypothetical protein